MDWAEDLKQTFKKVCRNTFSNEKKMKTLEFLHFLCILLGLDGEKE